MVVTFPACLTTVSTVEDIVVDTVLAVPNSVIPPAIVEVGVCGTAVTLEKV
jgi:tartrate dehydratase alpha subunit/fumarate hydratase class I-like protein